MIRVALALVIGAVLVFGAVTMMALEGREVVVVQTRDQDGRPRTTRTWIADAEGFAWIESANPERGFLGDLAREPDLEVGRGGAVQQCRAVILPNPAGHRRIRELLAAKYGWADGWIGLLADTERSVAVRLDCVRDDRSPR